MSIVEVIKKSFAQTPKLINIVLIFSVFNVLIGLISLPLSDPANTGSPGIIAASALSSILFFLIFILLQGGALGSVKDQIKGGTFAIASFIGYGKKFYVRILSLLLLYVLVAIGVVLVLSMISAGILLLGDNVVTRSLVAVIVTAAAVTMITLLIYPIYVIVAEDAGALDGFKKGIGAARANFTKTLGLFMGLLVISLIISLVIGFITGLITAPLGGVIGQILITIVNAAVQSYISVVMMIAFMSLYLSLSSSSSVSGIE
ncbi:MAG: hypothetical protein ABH862_00750 [Candidatus Omnitrophota bacterium]